MSSVAAILSGLCPKSSITVTPPASPTSSKRRRRPVKPASAATASASGTPAATRRADRGQRVRDIVAAGHLQRAPAIAPRRRATGRSAIANGSARQVCARRDRPSPSIAKVSRPVARQRARRAPRVSALSRLTTAVSALRDEVAEQRAQFVQRLVVEADVVEHRDRRPVARDRAVALVHLADEDVAVADQRAGEGRVGRDEILHHRAVHHRRVAAGGVQDPADHAGDGRLAAGAGDADRQRRGVEQLGEQFGAGQPRGSRARRAATMSGTVSSTAAEATTIWSADDDAAAVLREQRDAAARAGSRTWPAARPWSSARSEPATVAPRPGGSAPAAACRCRRCRRRNRICRSCHARRALSARARHGASGGERTMRIGVVAPARADQRGGRGARSPRSRRCAYPEVELVFHPQCFVTARPFRRHGRGARRGLPRIRQRSRLRRDLVRARRLWLVPHPDAVHAAARAGGAAQGLSRLFATSGFLLGALYARRIGRPGARADAERHQPRRRRRDGRARRSAGWRAATAQGWSRGSTASPAAAFNLSILDRADRHAVAARPHRPCADVEEVSEPMYNDRPDAVPLAQRDAAQGHRRRAARRGQRRAAERPALGRDARVR